MWKGLIAPEIAVKYWELEQGSTMKDVILGKQVPTQDQEIAL